MPKLKADEMALTQLINSTIFIWGLGAIAGLMGAAYAGKNECNSRATIVMNQYSRLILELEHRLRRMQPEKGDLLTQLSTTYVINEFKDKTFGELANNLAEAERDIDVH